MTPASTSSDERAGAFVVQRDPEDDVAFLLGAPDTKDKLDEVAVSASAWRAFEEAGLVERWQAFAEGLLGPYEEAWFTRDRLAAFVEVALATSRALDDDERRVLDDVIALARAAEKRGVPLVYVG